MDRYMYQIHPRKPIVKLIPGKAIRKPMGIKLTKDEVKICMQFGPVYRSFPSIPLIRVTGSNLDSLHVSQEEYLNKKDLVENTSNATENGSIDVIAESTPAKEPKTEAPTEKKEEEKPIPVPVEPGPVIIEEEKKEEPEPVPVPVEPGPVIPKKEEEPVPVPVEPGPVIVEESKEEVEEESVEEETEESDESVEDADDEAEDSEEEDDEEEEDVEESLQVSAGNVIKPQGYNPNRKRNKHHKR